ncbi:MAG: AMP-binding protein, partial [Odoribacteraceae bacterium]|nr:AMP-binding protein [Odoribacteraceae bacterium]
MGLANAFPDAVMTFRVEGFPVPAGVIAFLDEWFGDGESVPACTSGSTGAPRRVDLLKDDMLASAALSNAYFGVTSRSTLLLCLSPGYIAGKMMIVRAILAGARLLAVEPSRDPLAVLPGEERVDLAAMVPLQVEATLAREDGTGRLARVRQLLVGGAALSPSLEGRLGGLPVECHASYGMTETASHVALRRVNGPRASRLYATLGNTRLALDDRGCLVIRAPHLRLGIFITNDLARLDG